MDYETEIDVLESTISHLECAILSVEDAPYHNYLASTWEHDIEEMKSRLDELYAMQDEQWTKELRDQNIEYERSVL